MFKFSIGPGIKYVPYQARSRTYTLEGRFHYSVYLNTSYELKILSNNKSKVDINLVTNIGLQQIFSTESAFTNTFTGEMSTTYIINNSGSFIGLGLTYSRRSDDKFKDLFKFKNLKKGKNR